MKHKTIPLLAAVTFVAAPLAKASVYSGSVLYPLTLPSGFSPSGEVDYNMAAADQIAGDSMIGESGIYHALLWSGSAGSAVDLNPTNLTGITSSVANGTDGNQQVGWGSGSATGNSLHAMLWSGSAGSAVDLNPTNLTGCTGSVALGAGGNQQVGYGNFGGNIDALLWSGSAGSAVDLNPVQLLAQSSTAYATNGTQQVGFAAGVSIQTIAILWSGTAASAVDLDPSDLPGIYYSIANGMNAIQQVGQGWGSSSNVACSGPARPIPPSISKRSSHHPAHGRNPSPTPSTPPAISLALPKALTTASPAPSLSSGRRRPLSRGTTLAGPATGLLGILTSIKTGTTAQRQLSSTLEITSPSTTPTTATMP